MGPDEAAGLLCSPVVELSHQHECSFSLVRIFPWSGPDMLVFVAVFLCTADEFHGRSSKWLVALWEQRTERLSCCH